ncbi:DUF6891 domain-containing protein [Actinomadura sp. HBU206391]|uniref:DUF6891 domain-containing protein n=1 Tax=Actinomadura sp. HBU206391 TaxID=2731692 RepID=UPI001650A5EF|nr:hypothetical protein [Actinomadura sp. HBU206391]MBC6459453.1 hypothetical protein [Actinomadura sp. HBU206391]
MSQEDTPPHGTAGGLPITVITEDGLEHSQISAEELAGLIARLGEPGAGHLVADRVPARPEVYLQASREGAGPYEIEVRDGFAEQPHTAIVHDQSQITAAFLLWARGEKAWRGDHDWHQPPAPPDLDPDTLQEAEELTMELLGGGFGGYEEIVESVADYFTDSGEQPVTTEQARLVVAPLWQARLAEQETWPEITDADRVEVAFDRLWDRGITAEMNFSCCQNCGVAEIREEADEDARGYVFFHAQDSERAAAGAGLMLAYGAFDDTAEDAAIGREVVDALTEAGLPVVWSGSASERIHVTPLDWRRRLPS